MILQGNLTTERHATATHCIYQFHHLFAFCELTSGISMAQTFSSLNPIPAAAPQGLPPGEEGAAFFADRPEAT